MIHNIGMQLSMLLSKTNSIVSLDWVDSLIIAIYFIFVLGIGYYLLKYTKTGEDFFLAGRKMTSWIAGLSFVAANLGSLRMRFGTAGDGVPGLAVQVSGAPGRQTVSWLSLEA